MMCGYTRAVALTCASSRKALHPSHRYLRSISIRTIVNVINPVAGRVSSVDCDYVLRRCFSSAPERLASEHTDVISSLAALKESIARVKDKRADRLDIVRALQRHWDILRALSKTADGAALVDVYSLAQSIISGIWSVGISTPSKDAAAAPVTSSINALILNICSTGGIDTGIPIDYGSWHRMLHVLSLSCWKSTVLAYHYGIANLGLSPNAHTYTILLRMALQHDRLEVIYAVLSAIRARSMRISDALAHKLVRLASKHTRPEVSPQASVHKRSHGRRSRSAALQSEVAGSSKSNYHSHHFRSKSKAVAVDHDRLYTATEYRMLADVIASHIIGLQYEDIQRVRQQYSKDVMKTSFPMLSMALPLGGKWLPSPARGKAEHTVRLRLPHILGLPDGELHADDQTSKRGFGRRKLTAAAAAAASQTSPYFHRSSQSFKAARSNPGMYYADTSSDEDDDDDVGDEGSEDALELHGDEDSDDADEETEISVDLTAVNEHVLNAFGALEQNTTSRLLPRTVRARRRRNKTGAAAVQKSDAEAASTPPTVSRDSASSEATLTTITGNTRWMHVALAYEDVRRTALHHFCRIIYNAHAAADEPSFDVERRLAHFARFALLPFTHARSSYPWFPSTEAARVFAEALEYWRRILRSKRDKPTTSSTTTLTTKAYDDTDDAAHTHAHAQAGAESTFQVPFLHLHQRFSPATLVETQTPRLLQAPNSKKMATVSSLLAFAVNDYAKHVWQTGK